MRSRRPGLIGSALGLEGRARAEATRALGWLVISTVAVRLLPYGRLIRLIDRIPRARSHRGSMTPSRCAIAVRRAARILPARCLPQAVAAGCLLRRGGLAPTVQLGVARAGERLDAHAWLECDGQVVVGEAERGRYTPLPATGPQPR